MSLVRRSYGPVGALSAEPDAARRPSSKDGARETSSQPPADVPATMASAITVTNDNARPLIRLFLYVYHSVVSVILSSLYSCRRASPWNSGGFSAPEPPGRKGNRPCSTGRPARPRAPQPCVFFLLSACAVSSDTDEAIPCCGATHPVQAANDTAAASEDEGPTWSLLLTLQRHMHD